MELLSKLMKIIQISKPRWNKFANSFCTHLCRFHTDLHKNDNT